MASGVIHIILEFLLPTKCFGCLRNPEALCSTCLDTMRQKESLCFFCHERTEDIGNICFSCRKKSVLDGIWWPWKYKTPATKQVLEAFKYKNKTILAEHMAKEMHEAIRGKLDTSNIVASSVPLHPRKQKERGFNQAVLLARHLRVPHEIFLERIRDTSPQAHASRQERITHMQDAFLVKDPLSVFGKKILLIDDVATTGSTITSAARTLKRAGAKEVYALVVAHG